MTKLTKRVVDTAQPGTTDYFVWCSACPGFGARVFPSGKKIFVVQVRVGRATRRVKIGPYGPFTVEQAREQAQEVVRMAASGRDPQRERREKRDAISVGQLCDLYIQAAKDGLVVTRFGRVKGATTMRWDEGRVSRHIRPLIGNIPAHELTRSHVQRMVDEIASGRTAGTYRGRPRGIAKVKGGQGTAARVVGLLGGIFTWAERRGLVPGPNPCRGVQKAATNPRTRVLTPSELGALGKSLSFASESDPAGAAALRLIALTGLRRQEACGLRWSEIDEAGRCLRLVHTKTGRSVRPIGRKALALLKNLPRDSDEWVFPGARGETYADAKRGFVSIFNTAGLKDARSHDLRRTFATTAADLGYSDATIASLLGHSQRTVTARHYIRRPDEALAAAADRVCDLIDGYLSETMASAEVLSVRM